MTDLQLEQPRSANRTHVPKLEKWAYNQMPKSPNLYFEPKLYRYEATNLYQWYAKSSPHGFEDPYAEPFVIEPRDDEPTTENISSKTAILTIKPGAPIGLPPMIVFTFGEGWSVEALKEDLERTLDNYDRYIVMVVDSTFVPWE